MRKKHILVLVIAIYLIGYFAIPAVLNMFVTSPLISDILRFLSTLPIPLYMIIVLKDIPMGDWKLIRLMGICYVLFSFVDLCFSFQAFLPSKFLGIMLLFKLIANFLLFSFSFIVTKHLILAIRAGVFLTITSVFLYLTYSRWIILIFQVIDDYDQQTFEVAWQTWYWYGMLILGFRVIVFVFQVLMFEGLISEME